MEDFAPDFHLRDAYRQTCGDLHANPASDLIISELLVAAGRRIACSKTSPNVLSPYGALGPCREPQH